MMITLRLYRQHDLDLITLYRHPSFSLPAAIKKALKAYVKKEQFAIKQPATYELPKEKISKIVQMHIALKEDEDSDIIEWIKDIKEGFRNSVLKNIIRGYLVGPYVYAYQKSSTACDLASENADLFDSNTRNITTLSANKSGTPRKKNKKKETGKVEDSILAKEILSDEPKKKDDTIFVERLEDEVKVEIPTAVKETKIESKTETKNESASDEDMWGDIDSMMDNLN